MAVLLLQSATVGSLAGVSTATSGTTVAVDATGAGGSFVGPLLVGNVPATATSGYLLQLSTSSPSATSFTVDYAGAAKSWAGALSVASGGATLTGTAAVVGRIMVRNRGFHTAA